jgi:hypothetical protein
MCVPFAMHRSRRQDFSGEGPDRYFRPESSRYAPILLTGGRFLLNDQTKKEKSSRRDLPRTIRDFFLLPISGKRLDRRLNFRNAGSRNARRIILTGGRFLLNDPKKQGSFSMSFRIPLGGMRNLRLPVNGS